MRHDQQADENETLDIEKHFTPAMLAELDEISAEVKSGGVTHTMEEVRERLTMLGESWAQINKRCDELN